MTLSFMDVAAATVQVVRGTSAGSGFQFLQPDVVVTNQHVLDGGTGEVVVRTESGQVVGATLLGSSAAVDNDFAVLRLKQPLAGARQVLLPGAAPVQRGDTVIFAGFPHGVPDLLVHQALVSGPSGKGFHLDGTVNGGNSGGPVVDPARGEVVGIVTQRRFMGGPDLEKLAQEGAQLAQYTTQLQNLGSVQLMGIDFGDFANLVGASFGLLAQSLQANANAGIGVAFSIEWVAAECAQLGVMP